MFHIAFYRDQDGNSEIVDFLDELQKKGETSKTDRVNRIKILAYLQALKEYGTHCKQSSKLHIFSPQSAQFYVIDLRCSRR